MSRPLGKHPRRRTPPPTKRAMFAQLKSVSAACSESGHIRSLIPGHLQFLRRSYYRKAAARRAPLVPNSQGNVENRVKDAVHVWESCRGWDARRNSERRAPESGAAAGGRGGDEVRPSAALKQFCFRADSRHWARWTVHQRWAKSRSRAVVPSARSSLWPFGRKRIGLPTAV